MIRSVLMVLGMVAIYPIFVILHTLKIRDVDHHGYQVAISSCGLTIFTKKQGEVAVYTWSEIKMLRRRLSPPFWVWELVLLDDELLVLHIVDQTVLDACIAKGIAVHMDMTT